MKNLLFCALLGALIISCSKDDNLVPETAIKEDSSLIIKGNNANNGNGSNGNKVDVCHNGNIINVNINAVTAHQDHGDAVDMDGDGYFDIDNECGPTDCDDSDPLVNETCDVCPECSFGEYLGSLDPDEYCYESLSPRPNYTIITVFDIDTGQSIGYVYNSNGNAVHGGWGMRKSRTILACYECASAYIISNFSECE